MNETHLSFINNHIDRVSYSKMGELFLLQFPDFNVVEFRIMMNEKYNNRYTFGMQLYDYWYCNGGEAIEMSKEFVNKC